MYFQLVAALTPEQIEDYRVAFESFDKNGSGGIDAMELGEAMEALGKKMNDQELKDLIENVDEDGNSHLIAFPSSHGEIKLIF